MTRQAGSKPRIGPVDANGRQTSIEQSQNSKTMNTNYPTIALGTWSWGKGVAGGDQVFGNRTGERELVVFQKVCLCRRLQILQICKYNDSCFQIHTPRRVDLIFVL